MPRTTTAQWGPEFTPKPILNIIGATAIISLFASLTNPFFESLFGGTLCELFCLSWSGLSQGYLWQPFTYLFLSDSGSSGITLFYLIGLTFNLYILWIVGTYLWDLLGQNAFYSLYFGSAIGVGLATTLLMPVFGQYTVLSGPSAAVLAILTLWSMHLPELEIWLFMMFPVKAKWLMAGFTAAIILMGISQQDWIGMFNSLAAIAWGYAFGLIVNGLKSPFKATHSFDKAVIKLNGKIRGSFNKLISKFRLKSKILDKVLDIDSGKPPLDDDNFIDAMLAKISRYGEHSLKWSEKERMNKIAEKKTREKKSKK